MPKLGIVSDLVSNGRVLDRLQWTLRRTFAIVIFRYRKLFAFPDHQVKSPI